MINQSMANIPVFGSRYFQGKRCPRNSLRLYNQVARDLQLIQVAAMVHELILLQMGLMGFELGPILGLIFFFCKCAN